jgi:Methylase of polypeptide chain release factors
MFFEIGYDQGVAVSRLLEEEGFHKIEVIKDLAGLDRVVLGKMG